MPAAHLFGFPVHLSQNASFDLSFPGDYIQHPLTGRRHAGTSPTQDIVHVS